MEGISARVAGVLPRACCDRVFVGVYVVDLFLLNGLLAQQSSFPKGAGFNWYLAEFKFVPCALEEFKKPLQHVGTPFIQQVRYSIDDVRLDSANAFEIVYQELTQLAPRMYHVPGDIQVMLDDYFSGFRVRFSASEYTTNSINSEVGIATGTPNEIDSRLI
ncbi:reverse transcriptase [Elysia marginata]|uniref:Reverse transcriptase n=1 Tax=Elysia marginata TaxID=1093978 RepID=A0AAV4IEZ1_9GAST|nr:reverse transcriptase [Elysia marginata]